MISSLQNPKVRWVRKLQDNRRFRREESLFVVEGVRMAEEALLSSWKPNLVLYSDELSPRGKALVEQYRQTTVVEQVSPGVMRAVSDTETPQGLILVLEWRELPLPHPLDFVFIPDGVRDPGNLGTMLRSAAAAGVQAVLVPPETVDPFAPKVVRSAMGAHFRLPLWTLDWETITHLVAKDALTVYLAAMGQGLIYTDADFCRPLALIIGGEASGAGHRANSMLNSRVYIPMPGEMESLNAATAAAVLLFEVVRQRSLQSR